MVYDRDKNGSWSFTWDCLKLDPWLSSCYLMSSSVRICYKSQQSPRLLSHICLSMASTSSSSSSSLSSSEQHIIYCICIRNSHAHIRSHGDPSYPSYGCIQEFSMYWHVFLPQGPAYYIYINIY